MAGLTGESVQENEEYIKSHTTGQWNLWQQSRLLAVHTEAVTGSETLAAGSELPLQLATKASPLWHGQDEHQRKSTDRRLVLPRAIPYLYGAQIRGTSLTCTTERDRVVRALVASRTPTELLRTHQPAEMKKALADRLCAGILAALEEATEQDADDAVYCWGTWERDGATIDEDRIRRIVAGWEVQAWKHILPVLCSTQESVPGTILVRLKTLVPWLSCIGKSLSDAAKIVGDVRRLFEMFSGSDEDKCGEP